jgi:DNA-binding response OmpR family regulator
MRAPFTTNYSRTLVVDASTAQGGQLSDQLNHAGFSAEFAVSWQMARATLRANYYHSCMVVADLDQAEHLEQISELRRVAMSVWIIVLCEPPAERAQLLARRQGVDAVLPAPFIYARSHFAARSLFTSLKTDIRLLGSSA